jgi:glycosyltransferase involved in cell wall biosynthesis
MLRSKDYSISYFSHNNERNLASDYALFYPPYIDPDSLSLLGKIRHAPKIVYNPATYRRFRRFLQMVKPDLVHAHNIYGGLTTAICDGANRQVVPIVMTLHDYKLICPSYLMLNNGEVCEDCRGGRYLACIRNRCHRNNLISSSIYCLESYFNRWLRKYETVRYFICPSRFLLQKMQESGLPAERLRYLPNAIDASRYPPATGHGRYALYAGRLSPEKGIRTLLQAVDGTGIPLAVAGDGPLRESLEEFTAQRRLGDQVTFHGYQTGEALRELYRNAAFVVVPSEVYENAPMTVLESFAAGVPVLGAQIGGIPEMVLPGCTGRLFPSRDVEALRSGLCAMWDDRAHLGDQGQHARALVLEKFSPARHVEGLLEIYRHAMG